MQKIRSIIASHLPQQKFDGLAVGVIDFKRGSFTGLEALKIEQEVQFLNDRAHYFDLASLTKPLTNSLGYFLHPELFDKKLLMCLNHRGGLPSWGLLPRTGWQQMINSYEVIESPTLYSDFSALRVMLEFNQRSDLKSECTQVWDSETLYWLDLPQDALTLQCGFKGSSPNFGKVHDPNAWVIGEFCSHAGLFSTVQGLCRTLINYQQKTGFIEKVAADLGQHQHRFSFGWDRVVNPEETLAGRGCSGHSFGHLGFTGTSIWIDPAKELGHVILSNAVKYHWYDKSGLNEIRREVGAAVWSGDF